MKLWKVIGLAGLAGVAASGVIIAREQRQRAQLTPTEVRARLHQRLEQAGSLEAPVSAGRREATAQRRRPRRWWRRSDRRTVAGPPPSGQ